MGLQGSSCASFLVVPPQWIYTLLPIVRQDESLESWVVFEFDAEEVVYLPLDPLCAREELGDGVEFHLGFESSCSLEFP